MFSPGWVWCQIQLTKDESMAENKEDDIECDDNGDDGNRPEPNLKRQVKTYEEAIRWQVLLQKFAWYYNKSNFFCDSSY